MTVMTLFVNKYKIKQRENLHKLSSVIVIPFDNLHQSATRRHGRCRLDAFSFLLSPFHGSSSPVQLPMVISFGKWYSSTTIRCLR